MKNAPEIPSNYYCGWEYTLNPDSMYILMLQRDWPPKEILEIEVFSEDYMTRVYDWQLRQGKKNGNEQYDQYLIENQNSIKIHSKLIEDSEATFVI